MSLTHLIKQLHFWRLGGLLAADFLVFGATDPKETPSFMLIVGFVLMSVTVYYLLDGLLAFTRLYGFPARHRKRALRTLALLSCGLLGLQSIGQLAARDVIILAPLTILAYFYVAYSKSASRSGQSAGQSA